MTSQLSTTFSNNYPSSDNLDGIVLQGYHKKLKTMKKKYFVLHEEKGTKKARLSYYDSEKKFKARASPKREIQLNSCFNINRRLDTKHHCVIALSTSQEVFCIVMETETELNRWLRALIALQRGENTESDPPKPFFQHIWQVQMQRKGIAEEKGLLGKYYVCLTTKSVTLMRIGSDRTALGENRPKAVEFYLTTIRRCGDSQCFFFMEVGRHSALGAGELWMQTEDSLIAQNMHTMIISAMSYSKNVDDGFGPMSRKRSSSANEASKPISMAYRRQTHSGTKPMNSSPLNESADATSSTISSTCTVIQNPIIKPSTSKILEISQTPVSTNSLNSSSTPQQQDLPNPQQSAISASHCCSTRVTSVITSTSCNPHYPFTAPMRLLGSQRRHSVSASSTMCHQRTLSLPNGDRTVPNGTVVTSASTKLLYNVTAANNSNGIADKINGQQYIQPCHQRTRSLPLTEEDCTEISSPSTLASTAAALKSFSSINNNNLVVKVNSKNYPCRPPNNKLNGMTLPCPPTTLPSSVCASHSVNNSNSIKRKLSYTGVVGGVNGFNSTLYVNGHSIDEIDINDKNNNNGNVTTTDPNILNGASDTTGIHTVLRNGSAINKKSNHCSSPTFMRRSRNIRSSRIVAMGRDRCDSLPSSRNRTASECSNSHPITNSSMPPPTRPLSNRPFSMCIGTSRHHSPPLSTLSPSTGCSESDGSSLSIDEPDCARPMTPDESGNFVGRHYNSHSSDGVIPEENYDDGWFLEKNAGILDNMNNANGRLTLPISTTHSIHSIRKSSPAASQAGSVDMQSQYMDMFSPYSPSGNSPCDQSGFMPVSPSADFPRGLYTGSSGGHSRASSLAEETVDGYVPMCPVPLQEYVDMEQSSKHHIVGGLSSAASSCSITSGTPSTDIRFAEYSLDKVKSRFTPDDEDLHPSNERPIRAYSVGSRPEHIKRKLRVDAPNTADQNNSRVRAFSVGSRATKVPRCDLYRNALGTNTMSSHVNNNNININNNLTDILGSNSKNKKSSSAPILVHKSQNSVDRMSDLMEIDFSKNSESVNHNTSNMSNSSQHQSHSHSQTTTASVRYQSFPSSVPSAQQKRDFFENSPKTNSSGYLQMKPGSYTEKPSPTAGHKSIDSSGYLEMRPIGAMKTSSLSSSPIKASTSVPKSISSVTEEATYTNMFPSFTNLERMASEDYMNMSPHDTHWDVDNVARQTTSTPDGYMEMSFIKNRNGDKDISNNRGLIDVNRLGEPRSVSSPIDIVSKEKSFGSSFTELFSRKTRRSDSHDSDIITPIPIHPSTIFPFSPGSPVKKGFIQNDLAQRKCLVDATSGTVTLSEQKVDGEMSCDLMVGSLLGTSMPDKEKILNTDSRVAKNTVASVEALSNDYADMSLGRLKSNCQSNETSVETSGSDYVNYTPASSTTSTPKTNKLTSSNRIAAFGKKINPLNMSNKKQPLVTIASGSSDTTNSFTGFKPISSSTDESLVKGNLRGANSPKSVNRQLSDQSRPTDENSSGYELLQMRSDSSLQTKKILSRPNSVNSEKISPSKTMNRPNSANSECMPSISTSSSTSTLCGSSSSSSTLCGSKSQSPLTSSRPQSFSDTVVGGASSSSSRPESVSSIADPAAISSRPPSVSSERELHYASLDLPPSSNTIINSPTNNNADGNSNSNAKGNSSTSGESSTSPSPNASGGQQQPTFVYAQIDFNKCENLKLALNVANNQKNQ